MISSKVNNAPTAETNIEEIVKLMGQSKVALVLERSDQPEMFKDSAANEGAGAGAKALFDARRFSVSEAANTAGDNRGLAAAMEKERTMQENKKVAMIREHYSAFAHSSTKVGRRNSVSRAAEKRETQMDDEQVKTLPPLLELELQQFDENLRKGIDLLKHGRRGKPHLRRIVCPIERPSWIKPGTENFRCVQWTPVPETGAALPFPEQKASLALHTATRVVAGKETTVMQRNEAKNVSAELCLSICSPSRTLDLQCENKETRDRLYRGFNLLIFRELRE